MKHLYLGNLHMCFPLYCLCWTYSGFPTGQLTLQVPFCSTHPQEEALLLLRECHQHSWASLTLSVGETLSLLFLKLGNDAAFLASRYSLTRDNSRLIIYELSPSQGQKQSHSLMENGAVLGCSALLQSLLANTSAISCLPRTQHEKRQTMRPVLSQSTRVFERNCLVQY